jgi:hypothetical protein
MFIEPFFPLRVTIAFVSSVLIHVIRVCGLIIINEVVPRELNLRAVVCVCVCNVFVCFYAIRKS